MVHLVTEYQKLPTKNLSLLGAASALYQTGSGKILLHYFPSPYVFSSRVYCLCLLHAPVLLFLVITRHSVVEKYFCQFEILDLNI